jgi:WD40 repeat protein
MVWSNGAVRAALLSAVVFVVCMNELAFSDGSTQNEQPRKQTSGHAQESGPRRDQYGDPLPPHAIARLGTIRLRGVRGSLTFSPDGKSLAAATEKGVTLWETATGCVTRQFAAPAQFLSFSADSKRLACSDNLHCHVVEVSNGKELFTVDGTHGRFARDGKTLVTANAFCSPWRVHVWDAQTGKPLRQWAAGEWIQELALSADGRMAAWINRNKPEVQIRDLENGSTKPTIPIASGSPHWLGLSPDGKMLATANGQQISLWNIATGKQIRRWDQRSDGRPVFSPDGRRLAWTGYDNQMGIARLWAVPCYESTPHAVGEPINNFEPPCWSPDCKIVAVLTDGHALQLRRLEDGEDVHSLKAHDSPLGGVVFTTDERHIVSWCRTGVFGWETLTGRRIRRAPDTEWQSDGFTRLLPGGRLLTTDEERRLFVVRDMETGRELWRFAGRMDIGPPPFALAPGRRYVAIQELAGDVCVLETRTGRCSYRRHFKESGQGLRLSSDGDVLVQYRSGPSGIELEVHHQTAKKALVLRDFPKDARLRRCLDSWDFSFLSPDGHWLVLSTEDGRLHRWDLLSGKEVSPLPETLRTTWKLVWSPEGSYVAALGSSTPPNVINNVIGEKVLQDVRVWDVRTGRRLPHLTVPNPRGGMHILFSPDERTMLTTDLRGIIHLWEVATGKERGHLHGHLPYEVGTLTLSADGRMLLSGGNDSLGYVWDLTGRMADGQWQRTRLSSEQFRTAWEALASTEAEAAYRTLWQLAADPEGSVAFVSARVQPVERPKPARVAQCIAALDSPEFAERERAEHALEAYGETIAAELQQSLRQKPSLEVRRRIEALVDKLHGMPQDRQLQQLRALEVLEQIGTPETRELLRKLAEGAAGARLTEEARLTHQRCRKKIEP